MNQKTFISVAAGIIFGLIIVFAVMQFFQPEYSYQGSFIDPPLTALNFSLDSSSGDQFHLSDHRGKVVLLFFGYTNCPDVCPTTLYEYKQIKEHLGDAAANVVFTFITVDPERDTIDRLETYVKGFDPTFYGLSGDIESLGKVWGAFGVYHEKQETTSAAGYQVDHTARTYVIDQNGNLRLTFPFGMPVEAMADDIFHLVNNGS